MKKKIIMGSIIVALTSNSFASVTTAKISKILVVDSTKRVYVYPVGGISMPAACATSASATSYYSFSTDRPLSREYLSMLLSAQASGKTVSLYGKDSCVDQSGIETLNYLTINSPQEN